MNYILLKHAHLAQLAEQFPCKEKVAGSTPVMCIAFWP